MEHLIGYTEPQPHNTDEKSRWQRLFRPHYSRKDASLVMTFPIVVALRRGVKFYPFHEHLCYNSSIHRARLKRRSAAGVDAPTTLLTPTSERETSAVNANSPILPESHIDATHDPDAVPEFDHPRTQADRIVLALRYPSRADAEPIASVSKVIAGRVYLLAVYDADVLAALVRMGWRESEAGR